MDSSLDHGHTQANPAPAIDHKLLELLKPGDNWHLGEGWSAKIQRCTINHLDAGNYKAIV